MEFQNHHQLDIKLRFICDVFYRNQTHLGKKSKLSWLLIMKVEIFIFVMTELSYFNGFMTSDWRPEQRYWQNRETANVGLDSSVGRAPARQSGGRRFKSRSSQFFFVHPNSSLIGRAKVELHNFKVFLYKNSKQGLPFKVTSLIWYNLSN